MLQAYKRMNIIMDTKKRVYGAAQKRAHERYIAEKTTEVRAALPKEYAIKLNKIAEKRGCSKAQVLKNMIDTTYSSEFDNE
jgi:hypothetical protein